MLETIEAVDVVYAVEVVTTILLPSVAGSLVNVNTDVVDDDDGMANNFIMEDLDSCGDNTSGSASALPVCARKGSG